MTTDDLKAIVADCTFHGYEFEVVIADGHRFLRAHYMEPDTVTMQYSKQTTRWWELPHTFDRDQVVSTAFKCVLTSNEHRCREWFLYRGAPIYQPHQSVEALLSITPPREKAPGRTQ